MGANQRKGASWEQTVCDYLVESGFPYAERRVMGGTHDRGDIGGVPGVMFECKNAKTITLSQYMDEVREQKANAGAQIGVAVIKRRNHAAARAYVVMELADFIQLID